MISYKIEQVGAYEVFGWAHDPEPGAGKVAVSLPTTRGPFRVVAEVYREHLRVAGIGDGHAGFVAKLTGGARFTFEQPIRFESARSRVDARVPDDLVSALKGDERSELFLNRQKPLSRCALVLIIKDEADYVGEWIEYHRHLGVD